MKYFITLTEESAEAVSRRLQFRFENHDDIFAIAEKMKVSGHFTDDEEAVRFGVGLKLFSSVMMNHRGEELFKDFEPSFIEFMKQLKKGDRK